MISAANTSIWSVLTLTERLFTMRNIFLSLLLLVSVASSAQSVAEVPVAYQYHPWKGKKVAYIGDSITDPNNRASKKKYWNFLMDWLGIEYFVPAKSGRQWNDVERQKKLVDEKWGKDFDAVFVFLGTNDFNHDVPMGEWFEVKDEQVERAVHGKVKEPENVKHRYLNTDNGTFKGRINNALALLKKEYADKQIVLITPIHRAGFFPHEKNWQPAEDYSNALGLFIDDYVKAVKEAANLWAVACVDMNALCGLYPLEEVHGQYFNNGETDRLHPNDAGHERMAKVLAAQLLAIPVF